MGRGSYLWPNVPLRTEPPSSSSLLDGGLLSLPRQEKLNFTCQAG